MTTPILLIEGVSSLAIVYRAILERAGNSVHWAETLADGLLAFDNTPPGVVILDGTLSGANHDLTLRSFQAAHPATKVILTLPQTMLAQRSDAVASDIFDVLVKPFDEMRLLSTVSDARAEILRQRLLKSGAAPDQLPMSLIGDSPAIVKLRERITAFAQSTAPVMVTGAAGTGKSDCARYLHSQRNDASRGTLHELACRTATPESLANKLDALADTDALLLHKVDLLPPAVAQTLLDRIKSGALTGQALLSTLEGTVVEMLARPDQSKELIHRLNTLPLNLPTLAQRQTDLCQIAEATLPELCAVEGRGQMELSPKAADHLLRHEWPGNIPQLINVLRQVLVLFPNPVITVEMLDQVIDAPTANTDINAPALIGQTLADIERTVIEQAIQHHDGSVPKAAKSLGVSPSTLYRKRDSWGVDA